jgi:hypothetical protein
MNEAQHQPKNPPFFPVDRNNLQIAASYLDSLTRTG